MNNEPTSTDFPKSWQEAMNEMQREWARLQHENARLRTERDQMAKALLAAMREDVVAITEEEVFAQIGKEQPLHEFLKEMRAQLRED
jgi:hypothetical protein